jgi:ankyrin repeat protein
MTGGMAVLWKQRRGHRNTDIVKLLLDAGADVNLQGGNYGTALQAASAGGHSRSVRLLLDAGADVNLMGGKYGSALQAAQQNGHDGIVDLLLSAGAKDY